MNERSESEGHQQQRLEIRPGCDRHRRAEEEELRSDPEKHQENLAIPARDGLEAEFEHHHRHPDHQKAGQNSMDRLQDRALAHRGLQQQDAYQNCEGPVDGEPQHGAAIEGAYDRPVSLRPPLLSGGKTLLSQAPSPDGIEESHGIEVSRQKTP